MAARNGQDHAIVPSDAAPLLPARPIWSTTQIRLGCLTIIIGSLLRLNSYLADKSIWHDEAALVFNLRHRPLTGFTTTLDYQQGTPPGFFVGEHLITRIFGTSENAFRALPLVASIAALALCLALARRHLDAATGLVAMLMLAASPGLVYFSTEVKQYSLDMFVVVGVIYLASRCHDSRYSPHSCILLSIGGIVALASSHAAVFVIAALGIVMAWRPLRDRDVQTLGRLAAVGASWLIWFGFMWMALLRHLSSNQFLHDFWTRSFLPIPPTDRQGLARWHDAFVSITEQLVHPRLVLMTVILATIGTIVLWRRTRAMAATLTLPWVFVIIASSVEVYPAAERLMLWILPCYTVLIATGLVWVGSKLQVLNRQLGTALAVVIVVLIGATSIRQSMDPPAIEELRGLLQVVADEQRPGDVAYVTSIADPAFDYYSDRLGIDLDLVVTGQVSDETSDVDALHATIEAEVAPLAGRSRVWVIATAFWRPEGAIAPDVTEIFDSLGTRVETYEAPGAMVYLYDLSDSG